jgi:uncharacterized protein
MKSVGLGKSITLLTPKSTLQLLKFRSGIRNILPSLLPENYTEAQKSRFIEKLKTIQDDSFRLYLEQLLNTNDRKSKTIDDAKETLSISFAPIHTCNLKCKYCFANAGDTYLHQEKIMKREVLYKVLDFVLIKYAPECKNLQISLVSGGEPFLHLEACTTIKTLLERYPVNSKLFIATNGTIFDSTIKNLLSSITPQLGISLDGDKDFHNKNRIYKDGSGTYDDIINNIKAIQGDIDLAKKTREFILMTVLTADNLNLVNILKHHRKLNASSVQIKVVRSTDNKLSLTNETINLFKNAYIELYNFLLKQYKNKKLDYLHMITNNADYFGKFIKNLILGLPNNYRCGAGRDRLCFTADGSIYPCDNFIGDNNFLLGNINEDYNKDLANKFFMLDVDNISKCKTCWIRYLCSGDCCYNSYIKTNDITVPDDTMCEFFVFLAELSIRLVSEMGEADKNQYKAFKRVLSVRENNNFIH